MTVNGLAVLLGAGGTMLYAVIAWQKWVHERRTYAAANRPQLQFDGTAVLLFHIWPRFDRDPNEGATEYLRLTGVLRNVGTAPANNVVAEVTSGSGLGNLSLPPIKSGEELKFDGSEGSEVFVKPTHPTQRLGPTTLRLLYSNPAGDRFETVYATLDDERFRDEATGPVRRVPERH
jgi:hypothetical protein